MTPMTGTWLLTIVGAIVAAALVYWLSRRRRRTAAVTRQPTSVQRPLADPALAAFAAADGEPPTEDAIARARLGGTRGAPELGEAPLVAQAREQTPRRIDDGHVA